jgi:hypothetical protein
LWTCPWSYELEAVDVSGVDGAGMGMAEKGMAGMGMADVGMAGMAGMAGMGIPSLLRPQVWAHLLKIKVEGVEVGMVSEARAAAAHMSVEEAKQIDKDVARSHSYDVLVASARGRRLLYEVLSTWLALQRLKPQVDPAEAAALLAFLVQKYKY